MEYGQHTSLLFTLSCMTLPEAMLRIRGSSPTTDQAGSLEQISHLSSVCKSPARGYAWSSKQNIRQVPLLESSCAGWKLPKPFSQDRVGLKSSLHSVTWVRPVPCEKVLYRLVAPSLRRSCLATDTEIQIKIAFPSNMKANHSIFSYGG